MQEAAELLRIGRTTVYALAHEGVLRPVHIGRSCRITHAELRRYVEALRERAADRSTPTDVRLVRSYTPRQKATATAGGDSPAGAF
jgi:excisionase family DNA binding protein